jgi:hypothetical protein
VDPPPTPPALRTRWRRTARHSVHEHHICGHLTTSSRTAAPGNSTSSIAQTPMKGKSPDETFPHSRVDQGIHATPVRAWKFPTLCSGTRQSCPGHSPACASGTHATGRVQSAALAVSKAVLGPGDRRPGEFRLGFARRSPVTQVFRRAGCAGRSGRRVLPGCW